MLLWLASVAFADCPAGPTTASELVDHAENGMLAYAELDEEGLRTSLILGEGAVPCLGETLLPDDAASLHRAQALVAFANSDESGAILAFRAALRAQPQYKLATSLAPPEGPIATLYDQAAAAPEPDTYMLPKPYEGQVFIDGVRGLAGPEGLPVVIQVIRPDGAVHWSEIVYRQSDLPDWFFSEPPPSSAPAEPVPMPSPVAVAPEPLPPPMPLPQERRSSGARTGLLVGTVVSGVAAASMFAGSAVNRTAYEADPTTSGRQRTNTLYLGSVGFGVATLGFGVATAVVPGG